MTTTTIAPTTMSEEQFKSFYYQIRPALNRLFTGTWAHVSHITVNMDEDMEVISIRAGLEIRKPYGGILNYVFNRKYKSKKEVANVLFGEFYSYKW